MTLTEGALRFSFGASCTVAQYESWAFCRKQLQRIPGTKAVDFVCINGGQTYLHPGLCWTVSSLPARLGP